MNGHDQALLVLTAIGLGMCVFALLQVRLLDKHEREAEALKSSKSRPAE